LSIAGSKTRYVNLFGLTVRMPPSRTALLLWSVAVTAVIVGSLLPASTLNGMHYDSLAPNDKVVHFLGYAMLALIPIALLELLSLGLVLAASMIPMGICLEFLQRLVPGRSFEVGDLIANSTGVILGALIALSVRRELRRRTVPATAPQSA
jgi:VanZ family protein